MIGMMTLAAIGLVLLTTAAQGAYVSVDAIPGGAVDGSLVVDQGHSFDVDVVIGDVGDLSGLQFTLGFDAAVLAAMGISSGGLFDPDTFTVAEQLGLNSVTLAETTFAFSGLDLVGPSVLATINFQAIGPGASVLALSNVVLSDSFGFDITPVTLDDGSALIRGASIPEPGVLSLLLGGILLMSRQRIRRMGKRFNRS